MSLSVDFYMLIRLSIFVFFIAYVMAKLEINIEGKNGWAEGLPTWRVKNWLTKIFWGKQPYTGYHFWIGWSMLLFLHLPFIVFGVWSFNLEALIIGVFLLGVILEDIFWFVFNPYYGLKKFNKTDAHWHDRWVGPVPSLYVKLFIPGISLIILSFYL